MKKPLVPCWATFAFPDVTSELVYWALVARERSHFRDFPCVPYKSVKATVGTSFLTLEHYNTYKVGSKTKTYIGRPHAIKALDFNDRIKLTCS